MSGISESSGTNHRQTTEKDTTAATTRHNNKFQSLIASESLLRLAIIISYYYLISFRLPSIDCPPLRAAPRSFRPLNLNPEALIIPLPQSCRFATDRFYVQTLPVVALHSVAGERVNQHRANSIIQV